MSDGADPAALDPPEREVSRRILTAELLSIGSELTVGETRDTNSGELARSLTEAGVAVGRIVAVPDRLEVVRSAIRDGLGRADLVLTTGGLGPTPDDLTREAIADVLGETPVVDPVIEGWLRELWARRDMAFPASNLKQAWLIPSATALGNPNGTAPGWYVERSDGRIVIALPGPPREMRPMWADAALPRLREKGLGADFASRTFRLTGIGESQAAEVLGEALLRQANPEIATYARVEAVDIRVSAVAGVDDTGTQRSAAELVEIAARIVEGRLGMHVWGTGNMTWSDAIGARLGDLGWRLGVVEIGTGGQFAALIGDVDWLVYDASITPTGPGSPMAPGSPADDIDDGGPHTPSEQMAGFARQARDQGGVEVGLAVRTRERGGDTAVSVAVVTPHDDHHERRMAFLGGRNGRSRAALVAAAVLHGVLRNARVDPAARSG